MPRKPQAKPEETPVDLDDLLAEAEEDKPAPDDDSGNEEEILVIEDEPQEEIVEVELTPAQKRLAAARAALSAPAAEPVVEDEPDEYAGLSEAEIAELKRSEDILAARNAAQLVGAPDTYDNSQRGGTGEKILFHVTQDGFTAFGQVWLRGQEIEVEVGTPAYERTKNALGVSWLDLRDDLQGQYDKWRTQYIKGGPFIARPNEKFDDEVAREDQRRNRSVPVLSV